MNSNALLFVMSSLAFLAPVVVSLPLLRQRRYEDSSLGMNSTIYTCPKYRWNNKEEEKRMTFTGEVTRTDCFLLFPFKREPKCTYLRIPNRRRGPAFREIRICWGYFMIRDEEPLLCQNITKLHSCRNNSDVYNATLLREAHPMPFMAVWKWKLEPYSCLRLEVNYTTESHNDILYFMNTIWTPRHRREEISPLGSIPEILIQSQNSSADVMLVFSHQSHSNYELVFKAIKFSNHKCRQKCSSS